MPVTLQLAGLKYKNSQGQFQSADCLKGEDADISIIAPDYSELTFPVNAGKLCTHDLKLYRAKQGIPTSENWTESHWDERTIEEELAAKYTKPAGGIPASDLADGVIPDIIDDEAGAGDTDVTFSADKLTSEFDALSNALNQSNAATNSDIGKAHSPKTVVDGKVTEWQYVEVGGGGGTSDYSDLQNKPQINGVTLSGNKTSSDLGVPTVQDTVDAVDDWLDENITNPDSPPLDRSLSSSSAAAPADIVGDINKEVNGEYTKTVIDTNTIEWTSGKVINKNGEEVTGNYKHSNKIPVDGDILHIEMPNNSMYASNSLVYTLYDENENEIVRYRVGGVTVNINIHNVSYVLFNYAISWWTINSLYVLKLNTKARLDDVEIYKRLGFMPASECNHYNPSLLYKGFGITVGDRLSDHLDGEVHHSTLWTFFLHLKKNTTYIMYTEGTLNSVSFIRTDMIYVNAQGIVESAPSSNGITGSLYNGNEGNLFAKIETDDTFDDQKYKYIGIRCSASVDFDNMVIREGALNETDFTKTKNDLNRANYDVNQSFEVSEQNLSLGVIDKIECAVQKSAYDIESKQYDYYSGQFASNEPNSNFNIGHVVSLFNSVRFEKNVRESRIKLSSNFGHIPTIIKNSGKLYVAYIENTNYNYDAPTPDETKGATVQTKLAIIDIATWELEQNLVVMKKDDTCGAMTISTGVGDPNCVLIDSDTVRITACAKTSDGKWRILYRDYTISTDTLGNIGTTTIEYNGNTYEFTSEMVGTNIVQNNYRSMLYMTSQYAKDGSTYYIVVGEETAIPGGIICTTTNFINFSVWLIPEIENVAMKYEGACLINTPAGQGKTLIIAYRLSSGTEMAIVKILMSTKAVVQVKKIQDAGSRACWFVRGNDKPILMHSFNNRNTTSAEEVTTPDLSTENRWQGFERTYPSVVIDNNVGYISFKMNDQAYIAKFNYPLYRNNEAIDYLNAMLDLFEQ